MFTNILNILKELFLLWDIYKDDTTCKYCHDEENEQQYSVKYECHHSPLRFIVFISVTSNMALVGLLI